VEGSPGVSRSALERELRSYLGTPYRSGGVTRRGMDCSGLVMTAFRAVGIALPRTVREQARRGYSISRGRLRFGDLVFFAIRGSAKDHVGVYLGKGEFIHASTRRGVVISSLGNPYYKRHYAGARRVIAHLER
jgi:cell wall-associated NlpC family hydrolase